jgi:DNA-binding PadR family transcriptional regulator
MQLETIYQFFQAPSPTYLNQEAAVCYILSVLLQRDSYGTELIQLLETNHPTYRLSDTILYNALKFLETEQLITDYRKKVPGRGRPRHMFQISSSVRSRAEELAELWQKYVNSKSLVGKEK